MGRVAAGCPLIANAEVGRQLSSPGRVLQMFAPVAPIPPSHRARHRGPDARDPSMLASSTPYAPGYRISASACDPGWPPPERRATSDVFAPIAAPSRRRDRRSLAVH